MNINDTMNLLVGTGLVVLCFGGGILMTVIAYKIWKD